MSVLGNIIWLICGGFFTGLGYIIGGLALCLTIVGIPFGLQSIKLGAATMTPFGMEIVPAEDGGGALRPLFNIIWLVLFGSRVADRGGAPGLGRGAGNHHHRASVCPPTSEIAPPGAIPLWAGTPLAVTVCPPDCGKGQKQPVVEPAEHLICAQDPPHPAGDGTLVGRCPQGRHSVLFGRGETPFHSDPAHTQQIERRGKSDWRCFFDEGIGSLRFVFREYRANSPGNWQCSWFPRGCRDTPRRRCQAGTIYGTRVVNRRLSYPGI